MEAATENKRGRPARFSRDAEPLAIHKIDGRTRNNRIYAELGITAGADALGISPAAFYELIAGRELENSQRESTALYRQGIFEQIGRFKYQTATAPEEYFMDYVNIALQLCRSGKNSKEIEMDLRKIRTEAMAL